MTRLPALFISHGAPLLAIEESPAYWFLKGLGAQLPRPKAILVVSAHWETASPRVSAAPQPETIHDFRGFPQALHDMLYAAPGAPDLAHRVAALLQAAGIAVAVDGARGLDHGAWVPLSLFYPQADIPVTQLSLVQGGDAAFHLAMGKALTPLADEGVLVLGSGSVTHPLGDPGLGGPGVADWAASFADWVETCVTSGDEAALVAFHSGPHAARNHPTDEHFLPLLVALGAGGLPGRALHRSFQYGALAMDCLAFGPGG